MNKLHKILASAIMAGAAALPAAAADDAYISASAVTTDSQTVISFYLLGTTPIGAFQIDIDAPADNAVSAAGPELTGFTSFVDRRQTSGTLLFGIYTSNTDINPSATSPVATVTLTPALPAGSLIRLDKPVFSDRSGLNRVAATGEGTDRIIRVVATSEGEGLRGDLDLDGRVSVTDVTTLVDIILKQK